MTRLSMFRGDDESFDVSVFESDGVTPVDLSGATIRFTAKKKIGDADMDAVVELSTDDSTIIVTNAAQGKATLNVPAAQTDALTRDLRLLWDLQITDIADKVRTVATGDLIIRRDVTRTVP